MFIRICNITLLEALCMVVIIASHGNIGVQRGSRACPSPVYTRLINEFENDVTEDWIYKDLYPKPKDIGVTQELLRKAMSNFGNEIRLKKLLLEALSGKNVELVVLGGSISRGAPFSEQGKVCRVYFNAIVQWWRRTFGQVTGSKLTVNSISIGGIGSDYYSYCLETHLVEDSRPKLFLWELSANDRGRYDDKQFPKAQPLEQLTRDILMRQCRPALLYINFFRGNDYIDQRCMNFEDEGAQELAQHYMITSISWRNFVCDKMRNREELFLAKNIFASDNLHPSILGHAQMAYLVINHLKTSFTRMLRQHACHTQSLDLLKQQTMLKGDMRIADIKYHMTSQSRPLCFTYFRNDGILPNNTLKDIKVNRQDDFHYDLYKRFKIRGDQLGGLQTKIAEQLLKYDITLEQPCERLVIITHSQTGDAQVWIDKDTPIIVRTTNYHMGTKIEIISTNLSRGQHFLYIFSLKGGFAVSGIAVI